MLAAGAESEISSFDKFKGGTMFLRELESFDGVSLP